VIYIGVDVQTARGVAWAAVNEDHESVGAGLLPTGSIAEVSASLLDAIEPLTTDGPLHVGIDAPRMPLPRGRTVIWHPRRGWIPCEPKRGRHCELVVRAVGIANPQWTPAADDRIADWMQLGFSLFTACEAAGHRTHEVFPSASYHRLGATSARLTVDLGAFHLAPKDILDAYVAAYTVAEFVEGRGCEVGGGDGLGTIILPRHLPANIAPALLQWPPSLPIGIQL
jgi:predicted nuclease with RNAse H fold